MPNIPAAPGPRLTRARSATMPMAPVGVRTITLSPADLGQAVDPVTLDPQGYVAQAKGGAVLGQGMERASEAGMALARAQLEAVDISRQADARLAMENAAAEIDEAIMAEPDETKWQAVAADYLTKNRSKWTPDKLSPAAAERFHRELQGWENRIVRNTVSASRQRSFKRAGAALEADALRAAESGMVDAAKEILSEGTEKGYWLPDYEARMGLRAEETAERKRREALTEAEKADRLRFDAALAEDPFAAREMLDDFEENFPSSDPTARLQFEARARSMMEQARRDGVEAIQDGIVSGQAGDAEIEEHGASLRLGAAKIEGLKEFRQKLAEERLSREPFDIQAAGRLIADIERFEPDTYTDPDAAAEAWGELVRRSELIAARGGQEGRLTGGVFRSALSQKHPVLEKRGDSENRIPAETAKHMSDLLSGYRQSGVFGPWEIPDPKDPSKTAVNPEAVKAYTKNRFDLMNQFRREYEADPSKFRTSFDIDQWVAARLSGVRAGVQVDGWQQGFSGLSGPDASLFPGGGLPVPERAAEEPEAALQRIVDGEE